MKLLLDANLSPRLAGKIQTDFPGSLHVRRIGALGMDDELIWEYAQKNDFAIVSKDSDFFYRCLLLGAPPKVVWLRVGNASTGDILRLLLARTEKMLRFEADESSAFLIVG